MGPDLRKPKIVGDNFNLSCLTKFSYGLGGWLLELGRPFSFFFSLFFTIVGTFGLTCPGPDVEKSLGSGPAFSDFGFAILLQVYKQNYFSVYHRRI